MLTLEMAPASFCNTREHLTEAGLNELILVHYPLAMGMAKKFCRKREVANPDDFLGVAGLAVVVAMHNALKYLVEPEGLTKYVVTYVRKRLMTHYQEDKVVATPARRQQEFYSLGYLTPITVKPLEESDMLHCWDSRIMEDMLECCPDELTRKVAHLRIEGYNDREIEVLLNLPYKVVRAERLKLKKILKECITGE